MSSGKQMLGILATLAILRLDGVRTSESSAIYVPCEGGSNRLLELEELIHFSDVVMNGVVLTNLITQDQFGTYRASVSYYYAYKNDRLLSRLGLSSIEVVDFPMRPSVAETSLFFLVRQPNADLSLYCMSRLIALLGSHASVYPTLTDLMNKVKDIASADIDKNSEFVPPYPNPCDSAPSTGSGNLCSPIGSYCTVRNTLTNETSRCTCITGYHGDGFVCTPRTDEAARMECTQCTHGVSSSQLCEGGENCSPSSSNMECSCEHFECKGLASRSLCATNGVTYNNECEMKRDACVWQQDIHKVHNGQCRDTAVALLPCAGMSSPLSTSAGLVTCSTTRHCPPMHFCHSTDIFDVCCPVTVPSTTTQSPITMATTMPLPAGSGSGDSGSGGDSEMDSGSASYVDIDVTQWDYTLASIQSSLAN